MPPASSDHWSQLASAEAWAAVAKLLEPAHPRAARVAWRHASRGYDAYCEAYDAHLPASRWDYDYGREAAAANEHATAPEPPPDPSPLPGWIDDALAGRLDDAVRAAAPPHGDELATAVARALAVACDAAGRADDAARLRGPG